MSNSTLSYSATLPPFYYTSGYNTNFSNSNLSATGNVAITTGTNSVTGANTSIISSSVNANGVNYAEHDAAINGNQLTIQYQAATAPDTITANINGTGVNFTPHSAVTNARAVTTAYNTAANGNFGLAIPNAAISTGTSDTGQNIVLKSLAVVGGSLTATYQLTSDIPNNLVLAPTSAPLEQKATVTTREPSAVNLAQSGASFNSRGYQTIGDVLAAANGISFSGTLSGALQISGNGQSNGIPAANAILAATLNPNLNLSPNTSVDVTDFISASLNSFQTGSSNDISSLISSLNNSNSGINNFTSQGSSTGSNTGAASSPTGVYNAVANASASNIRGTGVNTVV